MSAPDAQWSDLPAAGPSAPSNGDNGSDHDDDQDHNGSDSAAPKRRKVSRSRAGCLTCRKRRKLCSMERPLCGACDRLKLVSEWWRLRAHRQECKWPTNTPGEASRSTMPRPRKKYNSTEIAPLPQMTPSAQNSPRPQVASGSGGAVQMPMPTLPGLPMYPAPVPQQTGLMNDYMGIFGDANAPMQTFAPQGFQPNATLDFDDVSDRLAGRTLIQAMLQQWAAEVFNIKDNVDPFDALSGLLAPRADTPNAVSTFGPPTPQGAVVPHAGPSRAASPPPVQSEAPHRPLAAHYRDSLSRLVACIPEDSVNGFDAFTTLATATASSAAGKGLHLATLAWAGRHMSNLGQTKYEAMSERLAEQAKEVIFGILAKLSQAQRRGKEAGVSETERMTLLGGTLMLVQFKVCRGDVWGFPIYYEYLRDLAIALFGEKRTSPIPGDSMLWSFFENLVFHDVLSSLILTSDALVAEPIMIHLATVDENPYTLTGSTFALFRIMYQLAKLSRSGRRQRSQAWNDETLIDTVTAASALETQLEHEKERFANMLAGESDSTAVVRICLKSAAKPAAHGIWQHMHEAFRISCLLFVRAFILGAPPCSIGVRFLVRQALGIVEDMYERDMPGFCSAHWVIFVMSLCAVPGPCKSKEAGNGALGMIMGMNDREHVLDDRQRTERLYDAMIDDLGFKNVSRSRQVVHEVWKRNQDGKVFVDWMDVVSEWEWELFLV